MHALIVDDHAFVCVGLKATLLDGLSDIKVSTASDGTRALDILLNDSIDLAVIDLFMPGGDGGFDFIDTVCQTYPRLPIIVLSASESPAHIRKCLDIGAMGFVTKSAPKEILFTAITKVLTGHRYIPEALLAIQKNNGQGEGGLEEKVDGVTELLTERQLDILKLISPYFFANRVVNFCNSRSSSVPEKLALKPSELEGGLDIMLITPLCAFAPYNAVAGPKITSILSTSSDD